MEEKIYYIRTYARSRLQKGERLWCSKIMSKRNMLYLFRRVFIVPPEQRIKQWLEKADALAQGWVPSKSLFLYY